MDANKIFGLFTGNYSSEEPEMERELTFEDLENTPLYWVGMYKKLIHNHQHFNRKVAGFLAKMDEELNVYDVETAGEFVVYNRAWYWISKLDITNIIHQDAVEYHNDDYLITYLEFSISYWEEIEAYEKCAHLKSILDLCKKS